MCRRLPRSTLFPYTTLFRSEYRLGKRDERDESEVDGDLDTGEQDGDSPARTSKRRSEEHTSELQSQSNLVCRLLLEKKKAGPTARQSQKLSRIHRSSYSAPV